MNSIIKVAIAGTATALLLWWAVSAFIIQSQHLNSSIDLKSLAHTRDTKKPQVAPLNEVSASSSRVKPNQTKNAEASPSTEQVTKDPAAEGLSDEPTKEARSTTFGEPPAEGVITEEPLKSKAKVNGVVSAEATNEPQADEADVDTILEDNENDRMLSKAANKGSSIENYTRSANLAAVELAKVLGVQKKKPYLRPIDVKLNLSSDCEPSPVTLAPVSVQFRTGSYSIRGSSMAQLELLANIYRRCGHGDFLFLKNTVVEKNATQSLTQMRFDQIKYFFLQHSVPKAALRYPEAP